MIGCCLQCEYINRGALGGAQQIIMARSREEEYSQILGTMIPDKINMKLIIDSLINQEMEADNTPTARRDKSSSGALLDNISKNKSKIDTSAFPSIREEEDENFEAELELDGGKRFRQYQMWEPPKYKILGYNQAGAPIFKVSDVFLTSDPKLRGIIDKQFNNIIFGSKKNSVFETGELSKKYDKGYDLEKLVENWKNKEYEDFESDKKHQMDEQELEEIVVNRGDEKHNYWLYKNREKRKFTYEDVLDSVQKGNKSPVNDMLMNPNFNTHLRKMVKRLKLQYVDIEEFESSDDEKPTNNQKPISTSQVNDQKKNKDEGFLNDDNDREEEPVQREEEAVVCEVREEAFSEDNQPPEENKSNLWGQFLESKKKKQKTRKQKVGRNYLVEEEIIHEVTADPKKGTDRIVTPHSLTKVKDNDTNVALVDAIIKDYNIINPEIINNSYRGQQSLEQYNRIELHLEDRNFFMTKLHFSLQKKSEQFHNYIQGGNRSSIGMEGKSRLNVNPSAFASQARDQSAVSGSLNGNQQTMKASNIEPGGFGFSDQDHETIEQKILKQMNHYAKKPIKHSEVATKLQHIKFSTKLQDFYAFHRHQFRYDYYLKNKTRVHLLRHAKPLKCKGTDLDINLEKQDPQKKFSRSENLSLASQEFKEFILVEYIEENPLLMSDVGMCERMVLQVNYHEIILKIQKDIIQAIEFERFEEMRDNPQSKNYNNISTEEKMGMWRKSLKECFGENGKVYLWQPKREGKLIGNPEGPGVAIMESNLGVVPVVKKTPNKRDFLIVRDGNRWVLRRIDCAYVSGQVEPKEVVFSHGDRPYQSFLQKYQMDFIKNYAVKRGTTKVSIEDLKPLFPNTPMTSAESRIRKILKQKMKAITKDNKTYTIMVEEDDVKYMLKPEEFCLYQKMQKSLCELSSAGINVMKNMEKMKSILKKYFKKNPNDLKLFAVARMIRDQLQLTSWYLTESFHKFIEKKARIQMSGHADPTNGHGGYSYIKKPQKERTDKQEAQEKETKVKLSGTIHDLRKLRAEDSIEILQRKGYDPVDLKNKSRWELVNLVKREKDTEYSRKQRETKEEKEENERKERSRCFNKLLKLLKNDEDGVIETYDYDYNGELDLDYYCQREEKNWKNCKQNLERKLKGEKEDIDDDDGDDDDS